MIGRERGVRDIFLVGQIFFSFLKKRKNSLVSKQTNESLEGDKWPNENSNFYILKENG